MIEDVDVSQDNMWKSVRLLDILEAQLFMCLLVHALQVAEERSQIPFGRS